MAAVVLALVFPASLSLLRGGSNACPPGSRAALPFRASAPLCVAQGTAAPLCNLLEDSSDTAQRLIFVGGKGGVGKTSTSSAIAVRLADQGFNTLIVSTDPAHSLSDALMQDVSGGRPIAVDGCANLFGME
ncbi:MAG: hypothetical protein SGPRY_009929, partial [Prymnesium sp.]